MCKKIMTNKNNFKKFNIFNFEIIYIHIKNYNFFIMQGI